MARTIGTKNRNIVKKLTRDIMKQYPNGNVMEIVRDDLPLSMWDTWESADSEINHIIFDVIMEERRRLI
jgi:hypothetical protein